MNRLFCHHMKAAVLPLCCCALVSVLGSASASQAKANASIQGYAKLNPTLQERLSDSNPNDTISVIVSVQFRNTGHALPFNVNSPSFRNSLVGLTRLERYNVVRAKLRENAEKARHILQPSLDLLQSSGDILEYQSHWLISSFTVKLTLTGLESLAALRYVSKIILPPKPQLISSTQTYRNNRFSHGSFAMVESNLQSVRARAAWSQGYTGKGRIICSFDTGTDGGHPALRSAWKGHDGNSSAAWFDPIGGGSFPHVIEHTSLPEHGSHTMGIMIGRDSLGGDTIGVAPGARWISAAVIDIPGASIVDAFEWAADPDRDPNTISDLPDVINHSWGAPNSVLGCDELFHRLIDNSEALGIVNIFAAGNEGRQGSQTIRNPANRALDSIDCFAVGFVDHRNDGPPKVSSFSSRGPSDCDGISIKPNIVAPGVNIRSSIPGGAYGFRTGSSMAAPHISGIVALLRQKNPDASPEQIKNALLVGAKDLGLPGPDNEYGWGYVNAHEALEALPELARPVLRVTALTPNRPDSTGLLRARVRIENLNANSPAPTTVRGQIIAPPASIKVISGSVNFGSFVAGVSSSSTEEIVLSVDDTLSAGSVIPLDFVITTANGVRQLDKLFILIGDRVDREFYTHVSDRMSFTVSNFGEYGFADDSYTPLGFAGLRFEDEPRSSLFEMALVIGSDEGHVSDGIRNIGLEPDRDFIPAPGGALDVILGDSLADVESISAFADTLAESPLGLTVRQHTFGWRAPPLDNVVVIDYTIVNNSGERIDKLYVSIFADWDIGALNQNTGSFEPQDNLGYLAYTNGDTDMYRGIAVLSAAGLTGHFVQDMSELGNLRNPFTEEFKYSAVVNKFDRAIVSHEGDLAHFVTTGPYNIQDGDSVQAVFAIVAGNSLSELQSTIGIASVRLKKIFPVEETPEIPKPTTFRLEQNFPNPFNPSTEIEYALETPGLVNLSVYNVLGQKVVELVNERQDIDVYKVKWNGVDEQGESVASGMYFYRLKRGDQTLSRKMVLLK